MSCAELAAKSGCDRKTLFNVESGTHPVNLKLALDLTHALGAQLLAVDSPT